MANDARDLLTVLRAELEFLAKGGYRNSAGAAWRPHFVFEDSPTCLNFDRSEARRPCSDCSLHRFIPPDSANEKIPCRFIPLNAQGETIDSFYRSSSQEELEAALSQWLRTTIERLEHQDKEPQDNKPAHSNWASEGCFQAESCSSEPRPGGKSSVIWTCANPDCRAGFDYREGRLFRFHKAYPAGENPSNTHGVQHLWLCGKCSVQYTLAYEDSRGVVMLKRDEAWKPLAFCRFVAAA